MNKSYPIKHWVTTLALGPLLPVLYGIIFTKDDQVFGDLETYPLFIMFGLLFSLPVLFIYVFTFRFLIKKIDSAILIKTILNIVVIAGVFITFQVIKGGMAMALSKAYSVAAIISSLLFRIKRNPDVAVGR